MRRNKSAAECIAFRLGWDMRDVSDNRYQAGKTKFPEYTIGDEYFCCPPAGQSPSKARKWVPDGEAYGRPIYSAHMNAACETTDIEAERGIT